MRNILFTLLSILLIEDAYAQDTQGSYDATKPNHNTVKLKNEIFYVSPIKITENGVGFELGYEKGIDHGGIVAFNLPLVATFNITKNDLDKGNKQDPMYYFMPGIKFYPTSSYGKVKYSIGPSIVIGVGQRTDSYTIYPPPGSPIGIMSATAYETKDKFVLGVMINNSININPSPHFTLGLDFGFGFTYLNKIGGNNDGMGGLVQGGFRLGYRL